MPIRKILIADDEDHIRLVSQLTMTRVGNWDVCLAASGEECLRKARDEKPDLILLDVMMPDMDGPTTLLQLRESPDTAMIPIIFLTAKVQKHEVEKYLELGALGVVHKPFDPMTLPDEIRDLVGNA